MNISEIRENIENAVTVVQDFIYEKGKVAIAAIATLFVLIIVLVLLLANQCSQSKKNRQVNVVESIVPKEQLFFPKSETLEDGYYLSRPQNLSWDEDEVNVWFEEPDESRIKDLSKSNDNLIEGILGAVQ